MLYVRIIVGPMRLECLLICGVIQVHFYNTETRYNSQTEKVLSQRQSKSQCTVKFNNGNKEQLWMNRYRWCSTPWWRPENLHSVMWAFTVSWPVGIHKSQWKCRFAKSQLNDSQATRNKTIGAEKKANIVCVPKVHVEESQTCSGSNMLWGYFPLLLQRLRVMLKGKI